MNNTSNYNDFHKNTTRQSKIITSNNFTYKIILSVLDKYISTKKDILDIGCGAGTISMYLASKGNRVKGVDISPKAIQAAKESSKINNLSNITFETCNFPIKIPNGKYDIITCFEVIEHLNDDDMALRMMNQLLKKNGILIISTPSENAPLYKLGYAKKFDKEVGHLRRYTLQKLTNLAVNNGFTVVDTKKTEGIIRNFLFLNQYAGKLIRFIKFGFIDVFLFIDGISMKLLGESDLFIILRKK